MCDLQHPGVVNITGVVTQISKVFIEMDFYPNGTLESYRLKVMNLPDQSGRVMVAHTLVSAISYMHSCGVVHRDIKMENVFMTADDSPVLGDFDISTDDNVDQTTIAGAGTLLYIAPEVTTKSTASSDMFATGCVLMLLFHPSMKVPQTTHMSPKMQAVKLLADLSSASSKQGVQLWKSLNKLHAELIDLVDEVEDSENSLDRDEMDDHEKAQVRNEIREGNDKRAKKEVEIQNMWSQLCTGGHS